MLLLVELQNLLITKKLHQLELILRKLIINTRSDQFAVENKTHAVESNTLLLQEIKGNLSN